MIVTRGSRVLGGALAVTMLGAVVSLVAQGSRQEHPGQYTQADIVAGSRLYGEQCASCHVPNGNAVGTVDLRRGRFRSASSDDDLKRVIARGVPNTAMPANPLSDAELTAVVAYLRSGLNVNSRAVMVGDAARGRTLFAGKGQCHSCHRVKDVGPVGMAPDLTDVALLRTPQTMHQSLVDPSSVMMPINRPVRVVLRSGETIRGRRLNEDTYSIQLINQEGGRLQSILKSDVREYDILTVSPMPSYGKTLTSEEVADLVAYLQTLRG